MLSSQLFHGFMVSISTTIRIESVSMRKHRSTFLSELVRLPALFVFCTVKSDSTIPNSGRLAAGVLSLFSSNVNGV